MTMIILSSVFALIALRLVVLRILARFQKVERGADAVRRDLSGRTTSDEEIEVTVWTAYPLSDHMIKEIAASKGFNFVGEASRYGSLVLRFVRASKKKAA